MIGCVLLGAAGLFVAARLFHLRHHGYWGGGCGHGGRWRRHGHGHWGGPWDGPGGFDDDDFGPGRWRGGFGPRFFFRAVADRLNATPEQERVLRDAVHEVRESASKLRGEGRKTRAEVAEALRKPHFDEVLFGELFARHDRALEDLRKAFVGAGARIHDALDERQRSRLAELIEAGPGRWGRGGGAWMGRGPGW